MVRSGCWFPRTLWHLFDDELVFLVERAFEALAADLNGGAEQALVLGLVFGEGDQPQATPTSELLLPNIDTLRTLLHTHDLLPALFYPLLDLRILVLLRYQLQFLDYILRQGSSTQRARDALIVGDLGSDPPLHTLRVHVLAAAVCAVRQIVLLFHGVEADAALLAFLKLHSLCLGPHLFKQIGVIRRRLLVPLRMLLHHFLSGLAHATMGVHLISVEVMGYGSVTLIEYRRYLLVKVAVLPEQRILRLDPENLQQGIH